jgi:methionyl-tRNA formyltransferase
MLMDVGLDTGPMLLKKEAPIARADTGGSLHDRLAAIGAAAILEGLDGYSSGALQPLPQPAEGVTYAAKLDKTEALIDWSKDALEIEHQVRAFNPWPVAETRLDGEQLRIYDAIANDGSGSHPDPGTIVAIQDDAVLVQCGSGRLALRQVQRPGRRPVSAADFARGGGPQLAGKRLG